MGKTITKDRCFIFGGYIDECEPSKFNADTDYAICADKGYEFALENKIIPDLIVGDFDSANEPKGMDSRVIKLPVKKDDTDLNFAVKEGIKLGYNDFILTGVTGGRLDQTYASITTLNFIVSSGFKGAILDKNSKIYIVKDRCEILKPEYDCYFSVFPFEGAAKGVSIFGAEYELENATLKNDFPIGVSNAFKNEKVTVSVEKGTLLLMIVKK